MKKAVFLSVMCMLMVLSSFVAKAQGESKDYFIGRWEVSVPGLPVGDVVMMVDVARVDGILKAEISSEGQIMKVDKLVEKEKYITLYFNGSGYDVDLTLTKKSKNEVTGDMLGQFDAKGKRIVNKK